MLAVYYIKVNRAHHICRAAPALFVTIRAPFAIPKQQSAKKSQMTILLWYNEFINKQTKECE